MLNCSVLELSEPCMKFWQNMRYGIRYLGPDYNFGPVVVISIFYQLPVQIISHWDRVIFNEPAIAYNLTSQRERNGNGRGTGSG
jgi:hypothetical protein